MVKSHNKSWIELLPIDSERSKKIFSSIPMVKEGFGEMNVVVLQAEFQENYVMVELIAKTIYDKEQNQQEEVKKSLRDYFKQSSKVEESIFYGN